MLIPCSNYPQDTRQSDVFEKICFQSLRTSQNNPCVALINILLVLFFRFFFRHFISFLGPVFYSERLLEHNSSCKCKNTHKLETIMKIFTSKDKTLFFKKKMCCCFSVYCVYSLESCFDGTLLISNHVVSFPEEGRKIYPSNPLILTAEN